MTYDLSMRINQRSNKSKFVELFVGKTVKVLLIVTVAYFIVPMLGRHVDQASAAPVDAVPAATAAVAPPAQDVAPDASATADARSEGQDVLTVDSTTAPEKLWTALEEAGYRGTPGDGCECFYVPVGTAVATGHGFYLATLDGWSVCDGGDTSRVCTLQSTDIPVQGSTPPAVDHPTPDASTPTMALVSYATAAPKSSCATVGNHICGPRNNDGLRPGCYDHGKLITPWTRYDQPTRDPLWRQAKSPCAGKAGKTAKKAPAARSSCATVGNHICGPGNSSGLRPGCYDRGRLVIPWTRYDLDQYGRPSHDPLWRQFTSPCRGMAKKSAQMG